MNKTHNQYIVHHSYVGCWSKNIAKLSSFGYNGFLNVHFYMCQYDLQNLFYKFFSFVLNYGCN
jgi:hypothetical protein